MLLFDGYDEIKDENKEKFRNLLQYLNGKENVWVTARMHEPILLENSLLVFHTNIIELNEEEEIYFLKRLWKLQFNLLFYDIVEYDLKVGQYAKLLLKKTNTVLLKDNIRFIGTPLLKCPIEKISRH